MTDPNILLGAAFAKDATPSEQLKVKPPRGIFAEHPGMTPKYALNDGLRNDDFRETMARMFIDVPDVQRFINSVPDESKALARVLVGSGQIGGGGVGYIDFLLTAARHALQEKVDAIEVISDNYVIYYFGTAIPLFSYSGALVNTKQDDQKNNMIRLYRDMLRGTALARRNKVMRLSYDDTIVSGTMANFSWDTSAENEMVVPFQFNLYVKSLRLKPQLGSGLVVLSTEFASTQDLARRNVELPPVKPVTLTVAPPVNATPPTSSDAETPDEGTYVENTRV